MFATKPLLAAFLTSAASMPTGRTTTCKVCAICPLFDTEDNAVSPLSVRPDAACQVLRTSIPSNSLLDEGLKALSSFGDLGQGGFITDCFYDNVGALVEGTEFCSPGPVAAPWWLQSRISLPAPLIQGHLNER
ncbi:hypothetical protein C8R45DRAFT_948433 [Mycena sanguinolenta]|nr:hypothetical protein C8R45DRAFT_948433 [Mycena sanguinolenta]